MLQIASMSRQIFLDSHRHPPCSWSCYYMYAQNKQRRKRHLANACKRLNQTFAPSLSNKTIVTSMIFDDRLRYIDCVIPKVGCTTWKRVLLMMSGKLHLNRLTDLSRTSAHNESLTNKYLLPLKNYKSEKIERRMKSYFKFVFVRNPFERIVSAYLNKFKNAKYSFNYRKRIGTYIVANYRSHATESALREGDDVTFQEFVRYLINPRTRRKVPFDVHWQPFHELCHPCYVK